MSSYKFHAQMRTCAAAAQQLLIDQYIGGDREPQGTLECEQLPKEASLVPPEMILMMVNTIHQVELYHLEEMSKFQFTNERPLMTVLRPTLEQNARTFDQQQAGQTTLSLGESNVTAQAPANSQPGQPGA